MEGDSSLYSSGSMTPLMHPSLLSSQLTTKERLCICCKPSFHFRKLKIKGAILVLIWSYLCTNVAYFYRKIGEGNHEVQLNIELIACGLTLSIAGWIADVRFGRYKVISLSIWIMWAALMLATVSSLLLGTVDNYTSKIHSYVSGVLWTIIAIGFGGFQANVIQFGIDQLHDASTNEIISFIFWYVWTYQSGGFVVDCVLERLPKQYWIVGNL